MKAMIAASVLLMSFTFAHAEETAGEKAAATGNDVKRAAKKLAHRAQETVCMKGDAKCAAEKAKNRVDEAATKVKDEAKEAKEKID